VLHRGISQFLKARWKSKSSTHPLNVIEDNLGGRGWSGIRSFKSLFYHISELQVIGHLHYSSTVRLLLLQILHPYQHFKPHLVPNKHPKMAATTNATAIASLLAPHAKQHFECTVPARHGVAELKEELSSFSPPLPTTGLKPILQARLQLAYLGFQCKEKEEEIGGWYRLDKAALQRKCAALGIEKREVDGKSMQVLLRLAIMKFCMFNLLLSRLLSAYFRFILILPLSILSFFLHFICGFISFLTWKFVEDDY
jgi:hypothetical protein